MIRTVTTGQLKKIIIDNSGKTHFSDWESFLRIIICPDVINWVMIPELSCVISSQEVISRDYFEFIKCIQRDRF